MGPLEILVGAFTGKSTFGAWFKKLMSQLIVYPLFGLIFFFSFFFLVQGSISPLSGEASKLKFKPVHDAIGNNSWVPPFSYFGLIGGSTASADNILWTVVSFMIFSQATKVVEIVQAAMTGKPFGFGSAIGEATEVSGSAVKVIGGFLPGDTGGRALGSIGDAVQTIGRTIGK
jgi:hypothetical protein